MQVSSRNGFLICLYENYIKAPLGRGHASKTCGGLWHPLVCNEPQDTHRTRTVARPFPVPSAALSLHMHAGRCGAHSAGSSPPYEARFMAHFHPLLLAGP